MGITKIKKTIPFPQNATVRKTVVKWTDSRGNQRIGTLTANGRVLVENKYWQIRYLDENRKEVRESTKLTSKTAAEALLAIRIREIERIASGITSREETTLKANCEEPIANQIILFGKKQFASGSGKKHIDDTKKEIEVVLKAIGAVNLKEITREKIESWIADEREREVRTPSTINSHIIAIKSFAAWAVETERITKNPLKTIKKLNPEIGRKKIRRSLTEDELIRLFETARNRKHRHKKKRQEIELVYQVLVGTGLRSTELSLMTPSQFDFERNRFTVQAARTKNKKPDILPIRPDLAKRLKEWINKHDIALANRIFEYNMHSLWSSFKRDCEAAGIERLGPDGRSIDVHSLRRTFGTMLARAGVPLTTTQRLMRHSTPELTAKLYIDVEPIDMLQAVQKLPTF